jgi:hypothetical protein
MHFIAHLFVAFHEREDLFAPPFTEEQTRLFVAGVVPEGRL